MALQFAGCGELRERRVDDATAAAPGGRLDSPKRTASSQAQRQPQRQQQAERRPRKARQRRPALLLLRPAGSTATLIGTRDIARVRFCIIVAGLVPAIHVFARSAKPWMTFSATGCASSVRRHHVVVVDQRVERLLHVDIGLDDAGLLQREARGEDRVALRLADLAVG